MMASQEAAEAYLVSFKFEDTDLAAIPATIQPEDLALAVQRER